MHGSAIVVLTISVLKWHRMVNVIGRGYVGRYRSSMFLQSYDGVYKHHHSLSSRKERKDIDDSVCFESKYLPAV